MLPPVASSGVAISIRTPLRTSLTLEDMVAAGNLTEDTYKAICEVIEKQKSIVISGGTGSGKTTLLAAMLAKVEATERMIVIEDSSELFISHPHVVSIQARLANNEGAGAITMTDLVRQSLRMRPDRIVVGEVRGKEISDLLLALNTGHKGSATTIHADDAASVPTRIEALGLLAGLPREAIHAQLHSAFDVVIQMKNSRDGRRGVAEIAEFIRSPDGTVTTRPIYKPASISRAA
jgi:pilus assembly protein CpaF